MIVQKPEFIQENIKLAPFTTYQIGGPAEYFVQIESLSQLDQAWQWAQANNIPTRYLGGGSNLLIADEGVSGLVIALPSVNPAVDDLKITVGAGCSLSKLVSEAVENGLAGLEWAAGIPGQVGGAIRGNAGAFGGWIADNLVEIVAYNFKTNSLEKFNHDECQFAYRHSIFKERPELLIWSASFILQAGQKDELQKMAESHRQYRREKHPTLPSAGCVFKNALVTEVASKSPELLAKAEAIGATGRGEVPAGFIVEQAGLSGFSIGGAQVSPQHANFLVNNGGAKAQEMRALIEKVQIEVKRQFGLDLILEVAFWP